MLADQVRLLPDVSQMTRLTGPRRRPIEKSNGRNNGHIVV